MANYTSADWTIAFDSSATTAMSKYKDAVEIRGTRRYARLKLTLPCGKNVVGGVQLPSTASFRVGMLKSVDRYILHNSETTVYATSRGKAIHWVMNTSGKKLMAYRYMLASSTAAASGGRALRLASAVNVAVSGDNVFYVTCVGR